MWNISFNDVSIPATQTGGKEAKFADDLNTHHLFPGGEDNEVVLEHLRACQRDIHQWGVENRVAFDAGKEEFWIIHRSSPYGRASRL